MPANSSLLFPRLQAAAGNQGLTFSRAESAGRILGLSAPESSARLQPSSWLSKTFLSPVILTEGRAIPQSGRGEAEWTCPGVPWKDPENANTNKCSVKAFSHNSKLVAVATEQQAPGKHAVQTVLSTVSLLSTFAHGGVKPTSSPSRYCYPLLFVHSVHHVHHVRLNCCF